MKSIAELKATMPQVGTIDWISVRPARRVEVVVKEEAEITIDDGLVGDRYGKSGGNRMVTLIQSEHLAVVSAILGRDVTADIVRRNILVSGVNLKALQDAKFRLGDDVILQGTGNCVPCSRMEEELGDGGYNAMRGHGGITAKVIQGGKIKKGDQVSLHMDEG